MLQSVEIVASAFSEGEKLVLSSEHRLRKTQLHPLGERPPPSLLPQLSKGLLGPAGFALGQCLAHDTVCVLAPAARPAQAVVAALGQLDAAGGRQVAEQAGQHQRHGAHEGPAGAAVGLGAGAGVVGTRAFVVLVGAVVEDALDQTHAGGVVDQALRRAQARLVAHPARRQSPGQCTLLALAFPTGFAQQKVLIQFLRHGFLQVQGFAVDCFGLDAHRPGRGLLSHGCRGHVVQEPLVRRGAAAAADGAGPPVEGDPGVGDVLLAALRVARGCFMGTPGSLGGCRQGSSGVVSVVVLYVGRLHLVNGQDGERVLQPPVGDPAVQQGLDHHRVGDDGDVVGNPGLHR